TETVLNMIRRFSTDWRADALQGMRRVVADVLIGNGDNHLKNWSFIFPQPGEIRLSPAYDIVPTVFYQPRDTLALRFVGTHAFATVNFHRIRRVASYLGLDPDWIEAEMRGVVRLALDRWPEEATTLLGDKRAKAFLARLDTLALVQEVRG
ncbi:HipA domain-containing protein, partial [Sphingomonas sp. CCH9-E2]